MSCSVHPMLGRGCTRKDSEPGAAGGHACSGETFWKDEFGGRADVVGQVVRIDGVPTEIVGVLAGWHRVSERIGSVLAAAHARSRAVQPRLRTSSTRRGGSQKASATRRPADALNGIARSLAEALPDRPTAGSRSSSCRLQQQLNGDAPRLLAILSGAIAAVLLIACTNVASLLAVRALVARIGAGAAHGHRRHRPQTPSSTDRRAPAARERWRTERGAARHSAAPRDPRAEAAGVAESCDDDGLAGLRCARGRRRRDRARPSPG